MTEADAPAAPRRNADSTGTWSVPSGVRACQPAASAVSGAFAQLQNSSLELSTGQGSHYRVPAIVTITRQKQLGPQMRGPWSW